MRASIKGSESARSEEYRYDAGIWKLKAQFTLNEQQRGCTQRWSVRFLSRDGDERGAALGL